MDSFATVLEKGLFCEEKQKGASSREYHPFSVLRSTL